MPPSTKNQLEKGGIMLFLMLSIVILYAFLHEGGHALIGLLSGGRITEFTISFPGAHVGLDGQFTPAQSVWLSLGGVGLTYLAWLAFVLLARNSSPVMRMAKLEATIFQMSTLLVWIVFPFLFLYGSAPSDDSINFLTRSGFPPLLAAALALLAFAGGIAIYIKNAGGASSVRALIREFRDPAVSWGTPLARRQLAGTLALVAVVLVSAFALNGFRVPSGGRLSTWLPSDDQRVADLNLALEEREDDPVYTFTLQEPREVEILVILKETRADELSLRLVGPSGYEKMMLRAEGYSSSVDRAALHEVLQPGEYRLLLTSVGAAGHIAISTKE